MRRSIDVKSPANVIALLVRKEEKWCFALCMPLQSVVVYSGRQDQVLLFVFVVALLVGRVFSGKVTPGHLLVLHLLALH